MAMKPTGLKKLGDRAMKTIIAELEGRVDDPALEEDPWLRNYYLKHGFEYQARSRWSVEIHAAQQAQIEIRADVRITSSRFYGAPVEVDRPVVWVFGPPDPEYAASYIPIYRTRFPMKNDGTFNVGKIVDLAFMYAGPTRT